VELAGDSRAGEDGSVRRADERTRQ
jgi:hypothetical protein